MFQLGPFKKNPQLRDIYANAVDQQPNVSHKSWNELLQQTKHE